MEKSKGDNYKSLIVEVADNKLTLKQITYNEHIRTYRHCIIQGDSYRVDAGRLFASYVISFLRAFRENIFGALFLRLRNAKWPLLLFIGYFSI